MELGNIIHYKSYTTEGMGSSERRRMITGRILSQQVRDWLAANVEIYHLSATPSLKSLDQDVFYPYLGSQVAALLHYRKNAPISGATGHVDFQLEDLVFQITRNFAHNPEFGKYYNLRVDPGTFDWVGVEYQVRPAQGPCKPRDLACNGKTFDDVEWFRAQEALTVVRGLGHDSKPVQGGDKLRTLAQDGMTPDDLKRIMSQQNLKFSRTPSY